MFYPFKRNWFMLLAKAPAVTNGTRFHVSLQLLHVIFCYPGKPGFCQKWGRPQNKWMWDSFSERQRMFPELIPLKAKRICVELIRWNHEQMPAEGLNRMIVFLVKKKLCTIPLNYFTKKWMEKTQIKNFLYRSQNITTNTEIFSNMMTSKLSD